MKCFYHLQVDAIGVCKNCYRGLCKDCAQDIGDGIACPHRCEEAVKLLNQLTSRAQGSFAETVKVYRWTAWFLGLAGLAFFGAGWWLFRHSRGASVFPLVLGLILLLTASRSLATSKKLERK